MPALGRETIDADTAGKIVFTDSGEGWRSGYILEQIVQTAAATATLKQKLPANAHVEYIDLKNTTAITLVTGNSLSVGTVADPDAIEEFASYTATLNAVVGSYVTPTRLSRTAESDIVVTSTNGSGALAGTWAGTLDVLIYFKQYAIHDGNVAF